MAETQMPECGQAVQILPNVPFAASGIYLLWNEGEIVYVGQASCIRKRIGTHLAEGVKAFDAVSCALCDPDRMTLVEQAFIVHFKPKYNRCSISQSAKHEAGEILALARLEQYRLIDDEAALMLGMSASELRQLGDSGPAYSIVRSRKHRRRYRGYRLSDLRSYCANLS